MTVSKDNLSCCWPWLIHCAENIIIRKVEIKPQRFLNSALRFCPSICFNELSKVQRYTVMELAAEPFDVAVPLFTPFHATHKLLWQVYFDSKVRKKGVRKTKNVTISKLAPSISHQDYHHFTNLFRLPTWCFTNVKYNLMVNVYHRTITQHTCSHPKNCPVGC